MRFCCSVFASLNLFCCNCFASPSNSGWLDRKALLRSAKLPLLRMLPKPPPPKPESRIRSKPPPSPKRAPPNPPPPSPPNLPPPNPRPPNPPPPNPPCNPPNPPPPNPPKRAATCSLIATRRTATAAPASAAPISPLTIVDFCMNGDPFLLPGATAGGHSREGNFLRPRRNARGENRRSNARCKIPIAENGTKLGKRTVVLVDDHQLA